jgi:hypothetical protein
MGKRKLLTIAGVAVGAAAIALPLTLTGRSAVSPPSHIRPGPASGAAPIVQRWAMQDGDVAAGFGSVWALACCDKNVGQSWVDQLDPRTGKRLHRIAVRTPTSRIAVGAGYVWVIGANPGGGGPSMITAIDPVTLGLHTQSYSDPHSAPYDISFAGGYAWVTQPELNQVWRLGPGLGHGPATGIEYSPVSVTGEPWTIATTGDGQLWVQRADSDQLSRITPTEDSGRIDLTVGWGHRIFGAFGPKTLIGAGASGSVGELGPADLAGCDACAQTDGMAIGRGKVTAAVAGANGFFVSTQRHTYYFTRSYLDHFSDGRPEAVIDYGGSSLAPDGNGVVIGSDDGGLIHWVPGG